MFVLCCVFIRVGRLDRIECRCGSERPRGLDESGRKVLKYIVGSDRLLRSG